MEVVEKFYIVTPTFFSEKMFWNDTPIAFVGGQYHVEQVVEQELNPPLDDPEARIQCLEMSYSTTRSVDWV